MTVTVSPEWWKTLFDDVYLQTDARSVMDDGLTRREIDLMLSLIPLQSHHQVLDLCGGHGRHSLELARRGFRSLTLLDYSRPLLARAAAQSRQERRRLGLIQADARALPLAAGSFDAALVLGNSFGYNLDAGSDQALLGEARRVLRGGGLLCLDVANGAEVRKRFTPQSWHEIGDRLVVCRYRELNRDTVQARELVVCKEHGLIRDRTYAIRIYRPKQLADLARVAGFVRVKVHTDFSPGRGPGDYGFMNHRMVLTAEK